MTRALLKTAVPVLPGSHIQQASDFYVEKFGIEIGHADNEYAVITRVKIETHLWCANDERWKVRDGHPVVSGAKSLLAGTSSARVIVARIEDLLLKCQPKASFMPTGSS